VEAAQKYIAAGYRWCVGLDLEKFFDRVSHDKLMAKIAERVSDQAVAEADPGDSHGWSNGRRAGESGG
jgi:retron-type reverse transcriptase